MIGLSGQESCREMTDKKRTWPSKGYVRAAPYRRLASDLDRFVIAFQSHSRKIRSNAEHVEAHMEDDDWNGLFDNLDNLTEQARDDLRKLTNCFKRVK